MDTEELVLFNLFEAGLWFVVAIVLAVAWKKAAAREAHIDSISPDSPRLTSTGTQTSQPRIRQWPLLAAAFVFLAFGLSDLVETQTGAWWKPWWLFAWKALCVHAMLALFIIHRRHTREYANPVPPPQRESPPENLN